MQTKQTSWHHSSSSIPSSSLSRLHSKLPLLQRLDARVRLATLLPPPSPSSTFDRHRTPGFWYVDQVNMFPHLDVRRRFYQGARCEPQRAQSEIASLLCITAKLGRSLCLSRPCQKSRSLSASLTRVQSLGSKDQRWAFYSLACWGVPFLRLA